jgi:hypothetical protein
MKFYSSIFLSLCFSLTANSNVRADSFRNAFGPRFSGTQSSTAPNNPAPKKALDAVHRWNQIAIDASGLDHTPVALGETRVFGEQLGPGRSARAMAIVHIAIFDSINAIVGGYKSYTGVDRPRGATSLDAAVAQAAHDTLIALFPSQTANFDAALAADLAAIKNKLERANGVDLGQRAAAAILAMRVGDGAATAEPRVNIDHLTSDLAGHWRQDPISLAFRRRRP